MGLEQPATHNVRGGGTPSLQTARTVLPAAPDGTRNAAAATRPAARTHRGCIGPSPRTYVHPTPASKPAVLEAGIVGTATRRSDGRLVDVAPPPRLPGLERSHDRVCGPPEMRRRVTVPG